MKKSLIHVYFIYCASLIEVVLYWGLYSIILGSVQSYTGVGGRGKAVDSSNNVKCLTAL